LKDTATGKRPKYFPAHRFSVEIEGLVEAIFTEVSGLEGEMEEFTYLEGGANDIVHHLPVRVKYPHLVLKRGMTESGGLWEWHKKIRSGCAAACFSKRGRPRSSTRP